MRAYELIRHARERAGLSDSEVATRAGLSVAAYDDVEQHADEFTSALSLAQAKALCGALGLNLLDVLILELSSDEPTSLPTEYSGLSRHVLLRRRREALGKSESAVANAIGFDVLAVQKAEADDAYLETLPMQVLADLARELRLPIARLAA